MPALHGNIAAKDSPNWILPTKFTEVLVSKMWRVLIKKVADKTKILIIENGAVSSYYTPALCKTEMKIKCVECIESSEYANMEIFNYFRQQN